MWPTPDNGARGARPSARGLGHPEASQSLKGPCGRGARTALGQGKALEAHADDVQTSTLVALAQAFGVTPDYLLRLVDDEEEQPRRRRQAMSRATT
jgi:hypothetical protein